MMIDPASPILKTSTVAKETLDPFLYCVYHVDAYPAAKDDSMEAPRQGDGQDFNPMAPYRMYHGDKIPGMYCRGVRSTHKSSSLSQHSDCCTAHDLGHYQGSPNIHTEGLRPLLALWRAWLIMQIPWEMLVDMAMEICSG
jgi:hypothetical protein